MNTPATCMVSFGRNAFVVYVVLMPFMSALAPTSWTPLPLLFLLVVAPWVLMQRGAQSLPDILRRDSGLLLAWALGCIAVVHSPIPFGTKNVNYSVAILVSYLLFMGLVRTWISQRQIDWALIGRAAHLCLTILSISIVVEFFLASFYGVFLSDFIPYAHDDLNISDLVSDSFKRPRAFSAEPGFTALCFECLWPLTFLSNRRRRWRHVLYGVGFLLLASAAAIASLVLANVLMWLVSARDLRRLVKGAFALLLGAGVVVVSSVGRDIAWSLMGRKFDVAGAQFDGGNDVVTVLDRIATYESGLTLLREHPLGVGWGTLGEAFANSVALPNVGSLGGSGMLSLYLDVAVASGVLGVACFVVFIWIRILRLIRSSHPFAHCVGIALVSLSLHHAVVTELQFPFLWFALAVADKLLLEKLSLDQKAASSGRF